MRCSPARHTLAIVLSVLAGTCVAQDFPADATTPTPQQLRAALGDKTFDVELPGGIRWRLEFKANGYFFVNTSNNFNGSGEWRAENGQLCSRLQGRDADMTCQDTRLAAGQVLIRRTNGDIIRYVPR